MTTRKLLPAALAFVACLHLQAAVAASDPSDPGLCTFYVAPNGNDTWSGRLSAPSGDDGPFATMTKARDTIRLMRKGGNDGCRVLVRGGTYRLNDTFTLGPDDSGTEAHPTVYRAYPGERPVLTGSLRIDNFVPYRGRIVKARIGGVALPVDAAKQFFVNGKRQTLARFPNAVAGADRFLYVSAPSKEESKSEFSYVSGPVPTWSHPEEAEVVIFSGHNYSNDILPAAEIERGKRQVRLAKPASYPILPGNRFFFQNVLEELDAAGEWYFDRGGSELYYWPEENVPIEEAGFPVVKQILEVTGTKLGKKYYGTPSHIRFEGFTLEGCQGSAVVLNRAVDVAIVGNTIRHAGDHGVEIIEGSGDVASGNEIYDVGHTGIVISGGDRETLTAAGHRAENNRIHHTGVLNKGGASGILCSGVGNVVTHNLIHDTPRVGIWLEGNDHLLEYNHVHHVNLETEDSGIIYSSQIDWTKRGNTIRFNYLHHSGGFGFDAVTGHWKSPYHTYGIYLDDWTSGTTVYGNIVADCASGGIFIHGGRDNAVENNIIVDGGRQGQIVFSAWPSSHPTAKRWLPEMFRRLKPSLYKKYPRLASIKDIETGARMSGNSFVRNIVRYSDKDAPLFGIFNDVDIKTTFSDRNLFFHDGLPLAVSLPNVSHARQWSAWKSMGLDGNSLIGDPVFLDAGKRDYRLKPESPAFALGFRPIPVEKIGLEESGLASTAR